MGKEKTLSLILASLLSLGCMAPGYANSHKSYASASESKNETISNIEPTIKNDEKIDVTTSLSKKTDIKNTYPNDRDKVVTWTFTITNNSAKTVFLKDIGTPDFNDIPSNTNSKNIYISGYVFKTDNPRLRKAFKQYSYTLTADKISSKEAYTSEKDLGIGNISFSSFSPYNLKINFNKVVPIAANSSLDFIVNTKFINNDYENPFDANEWIRSADLTDKDSRCLFNTDHEVYFKYKLCYDLSGIRPITAENLPEGSNFTNQAMGKIRLDARIGDLSFGGTTNEPSEILIKNSDENDYEKVSGKAEAKTDKTLRFVAPVKISDINTAYQKALKNADQNQYLINPSFLIEKEADDGSLEQKFYIRPKSTDTLIELEQDTENIEGRAYYKLSLPSDKLSDFMTEFDFVYDVKFTNTDRTRGLDKKVKLDFDNLGNVIKTDGNDLTVEFKAAYQDAKVDYQVDFETLGHGEIEPQTIAKGKLVNKPEDPSAEGYSFEGWYGDKEFTQAFDFAKEITENTTIYAKWAKLFDITYEFISETEGKELPESINDLLKTIENKKYKVGANVNAPDIEFKPIKVDGETWTFAGWNNKEIVVSENSENNKFIGKWTLVKENQPQPDNNDPDGKGNENHPPKPGEGNEGNIGNKDKENPAETDEKNPNHEDKPSPAKPEEEGPKPPKPEGDNKADQDKNKEEDSEKTKDPDSEKTEDSSKPEEGSRKDYEEEKDQEADLDRAKENKEKESSDKNKDDSLNKIDKTAPAKKADKEIDTKDIETNKDEAENLEKLNQVIRLNTDIYRPLPKGYVRLYFNPGKDAYLKYNPTFANGEVIAFDIKETLTLGQAKKLDKGLIIPTAVAYDKSLKFVGWSPSIQPDEDLVEGAKYTALFEKINKAQDNIDKKSGENKAIKKEEKQKENPSKDGKDLVKANENKDKKLIAAGEISKKENVKTQKSLANKSKPFVNKNTSPRTGVAGLGLVSGILVLSSAGLYLSKKSKKD